MRITHSLFKLARFVESTAAHLQGKGYGSATIRKENQLVHSLLGKKSRLAIDIGGNIGEYTAEIRRLNPDSEIHTFEPSATNIEKLNLRFAHDHKIKVLPFAISDSTGEATLFSDESGSGLASLTRRKLAHFNIEFNMKENVTTIKFEDYWRTELKKRDIDIVKIDIEGHELFALKSFGESVFSTKVIQFEFGGCNIDTRTYFQDFWYFFKERNFDLYRITPLNIEHIKRYRESDEYFRTTNYVAVNNK